ncbi:Fic family protein [Accumulibacter sp.]|uniref:Fic family protein n=1 Tax=Candidatus Accumulibacter proximus TaxID=2954385 RepID=A0A935PW31_9PROT|nr:Fic family protein [Accumulibacter sp.]MBK7674399.1 Fic family protein [Candidatus Accumulibacter proximus]MBL8374327.1 Fic family protein [Accumulibacter sp.]
MHDKILLEDCSDLSRRIDTDRFGPFVFQPGFRVAAVDLALHRVEDAHARFVASPLSQVANRLQQEILVSSVFGTNTIEGGTLSEEETASALSLDPRQVQAVEQQRALNIKAAYDLSQAAAKTPGWSLTTEFIIDLHRLITADIPHEDNRPGLIRDNPKTRVTYVGDAAHGGRYKPPQYGKDIERLLSALIAWHGELAAAGIPALIRAPLVHFYYERIHPFWDGNGRVGRVIEATLLQTAGYRYAPFALARYYLQNIDAYFTLFNGCRKAAEKGRDAPNQAFVDFHLEGMRQTINTLHDRVNLLVNRLLYESRIRRALDDKRINARQYTILSFLLDRGRPLPLDEVRRAPWYTSLYLKLNDKTRQRDLHRLRELELAFLDTDNALWPGFVVPGNIKPLGKPESR